MKSDADAVAELLLRSHPARGAWIEIAERGNESAAAKSHPARGAWIEISTIFFPTRTMTSHPARGAWIEISRFRTDYRGR